MVYPELMTIPFNTTKAEILTTIKRERTRAIQTTHEGKYW
jgi:hypothetical protein